MMHRNRRDALRRGLGVLGESPRSNGRVMASCVHPRFESCLQICRRIIGANRTARVFDKRRYDGTPQKQVRVSCLRWRGVEILLAPAKTQRGFMIIYGICLVTGLIFTVVSV